MIAIQVGRWGGWSSRERPRLRSWSGGAHLDRKGKTVKGQPSGSPNVGSSGSTAEGGEE